MKTNNPVNFFLPLFVVICIFSLFFNACTTKKIERTLKGNIWWIDTVIYRNNEVYYDMRYYMGVNAISFEKDKIDIPGIPCYEDLFTWSEEGTWTLVESEGEIPYYLSIKSKNEVFNGAHQLWFYKDEKKGLFKMVLFSDKLYLVATKDWLSYDYTNDVVKATAKRVNVDR